MISVVANWKMNMSTSEAREYLELFFTQHPPLHKIDLLIAPPFIVLPFLKTFINHHSFRITAQNVHWESKGAFTGEISPAMLKDVLCSHVIIGHSERRQFFSESNELVASKARAVLLADMVPIVCIGEDLQAYKEARTQEILHSQLHLIKELSPIWIAYEPVWSIGSGQIPSSQEISIAVNTIKTEMPQSRVLYGGSVNSNNLSELIKVELLDGFLVGGLSLKPCEFSSFLHQLTSI
jgi:triosephosphate isomerase (TIM)